MLRVFIDESEDETPYFVMAGYVSTVEQWALFSDEWQIVLDADPSVNSLHMKNASYDRQIDKLDQYLELIKKYAIHAFCVTIDRRFYTANLASVSPRQLATPYMLCFGAVLAAACQWQIASGLNEAMEFIFDERKHEASYINYIQPWNSGLFPKWVMDRVPNRPIHLNDEDSPPLQAADMLAWAVRKMSHHWYNKSPVDSVTSKIVYAVTGTQFNITREMLTGMRRNAITSAWKNFRSTHSGPEWFFKPVIPRLADIHSRLNFEQMAQAEAGSIVTLQTTPAKESSRLRFVHKCELHDSAHLHRRAGNVCLGTN